MKVTLTLDLKDYNPRDTKVDMVGHALIMHAAALFSREVGASREGEHETPFAHIRWRVDETEQMCSCDWQTDAVLFDRKCPVHSSKKVA